MSNTKHTSGPWVYSPIINFSGTLVSFIQSGEVPVAQLRGLTTGQEEEAAANAKLIAAAPEMLEAAEKLLEVIGHVGGVEIQIKALIAAIKKATK